ncbi:ESCRT-II complex subunit-domain-containing protein [Cantharellus anzutake]|uniref:ESCRT-II complex subunit-domain-containing protein n=1 Tax=Cantharellus anzutake TaxID=1750568 RepID=UPI0019078976|nr:ESCRT-II complex subunit-domain-containing protein [Cantharellus anzutake]KAF8329572.1 ESCRT-II complex subunit-domain-containing protein [Cantharellus anzutake]
MSNWARVVISFARYHRIWAVLDDGVQDWTDPSNPWHSLFHNPRIKRTLTRGIQSHIFTQLHATGVFQREPGKVTSLVYWESRNKWGEVMWDWIDKTGQMNTILTAYELTELDSLSPMKGAPISLFVAVINYLRESGRAQLIGGGEDTGVRFLTP